VSTGNYSWYTTNITAGYDESGDECAASCHFSISADWGRKWIYADTQTGACVACHGEFGAWNGNVANHLQGGNLMSNHTDDGTSTWLCGECHVIEDTDYTFTYGTNDWNPDAGETSHHGDSQIQVNSDANYNDGTLFCTRCHTTGSAYQVGDTGWTVDTSLTGVIMAGNCTGCHITGDGGSLVYPEGANTDEDGSELNSGAHQKHADAIVDAANGVSDPNQTCDFCHPANNHSGDVSLPADMGSYKTMSGTADGDAIFNMDDPSGVGSKDNTCSNVNCHNNNKTPDWYVTAGAPDFTPPTVSNLLVDGSGTPSIQEGTASVTLTADASDTESNIAAGEYFVATEGSAGAGTVMQAQTPPFDTQNEGLTASVDTSGWTAAGSPYLLYVDAKDTANNWGPAVASTVSVTVTAKDDFSVSGAAGATESVTQGQSDVVVSTLTFSGTVSGASTVQALQVAGTKGAGAGSVYVDVAQVKIYDDTGGTPGSWDGTDQVIGSGFFNTSNNADIDITDVTVPQSGTVVVHLIYDISAGATPADVIGGNVTGVTYLVTDNLTGTLPVVSGDIKTVTAAGDTTPPDPVSDLATSTGTNYGEVDLIWSRVGDDGSTGTAASYYDIRYNTVEVNSGNWDTAIQVVGEPVPSAPPGSDSMTVTGLTGGDTFFFAMKTADEVPNISAISNTTSAVARSDTFPPTFGGITGAVDAVASGEPELERRHGY
jgi:hypothetical protein